jgi:hypothetical protein
VCTEDGTVLRDVTMDFFFSCWYLVLVWNSSVRAANTNGRDNGMLPGRLLC